MAAGDAPSSSPTDPHSPASFLAAAAALETISNALSDAQRQTPGGAPPGSRPELALASLLLLRQIREQLAGWETGLIETARDAGASWADLAHPLGVASRQAAERRYLRNRPGPAGSTGEQRVQATRDRRAVDRDLAAWARHHAADLRGIVGRITALTDLPPAAHRSLAQLHAALSQDDAAALLIPLTATRPYLTPTHPHLAAQLDTLTDTAPTLTTTPH